MVYYSVKKLRSRLIRSWLVRKHTRDDNIIVEAINIFVCTLLSVVYSRKLENFQQNVSKNCSTLVSAGLTSALLNLSTSSILLGILRDVEHF